jgi:hypothetical protein
MGTALARRPLSFNFTNTLPVATRFLMSHTLAPMEASRMFRSVLALLVRVGASRQIAKGAQGSTSSIARGL